MDNKTEPSEWYYWGQWPSTVLYHTLWFKYNDSRAVRSEPEFYLPVFKVLDGKYFFKQADLDRIAAFVRHKIDHDAEWFEQFFRRCEHEIEQFGREAGGLGRLLNASEEALAYSFMIELLDRSGTQSYIEDQARNRGIESFVIFDAIYPRRKTLLAQFNETISQSRQADVLKQYAWVGTHGFAGAPLDEGKLSELTVEHTKSSSERTPPKGFETVVEIGSQLAFWRSYIIENVDASTFGLWDILRAIGRRNRLSWNDIVSLTKEEVVSLEKGLPIAADTKARQKKCGFIIEGETYRTITGEEHERELATHEDHAVRSGEEIRGRIAQNGKVTGTVRIILDSADIHRVQAGDILVALETQPDYVIGMKRAAAIVTDHGGITSHAALLSRELGKPCIVGTGNATKVLKDGDSIEVDADKGIVRIIEKR